MKRVVSIMPMLMAASVFVGTVHAAIEIRSDYPGGNVKVLGIDEANGVVRVAPDLRDTEGKWFHFDFTVRGAAGRTLRFQFPQDGYEYLASLGPAISRDGGATWAWLNADGKRYKPINYFNYAFALHESETRFAFSIPYTQKNWDAASVRWRGKDGVELGVLCKSQSGERDTEMLRIRCRKGKAKWLFAFTARHHACETTANFVMEGIIDEILSGSLEGEWIRDNADCVFIPFMDKDGVENGDQGKNRRPHDHNRDYIEGRYTSVRAFKELIARESSGRQIVFFDLHSPNQRGELHETAHCIGCGWLPEANARWHSFRRNWIEAQKGGRLSYDGKMDYVSTKKNHDDDIAKGFSTARHWVQDLTNCWLSVCCEFGYSLCGGVYSQDGGRELGHNLLKAATASAAAWADADSSTYTALKSINGNGSGVIVTDFIPAGTEIVKFKYKPSSISTPNDTVFCSRYWANNQAKAQFSGFRMSDKFRFDRSTTKSTCNTTTLSVGVEYEVVVNFGGTAQGSVTINDTAQSLSAAMVTTGYTPGSVLVLFANHTCAQNVTPTASTADFGAKATGDLYYLQLWNADGETLEHDFRPAMRDSDHAIGLYDTVAHKFWGATVGFFTFEELNAVPTATWTGAANNGDFSDSGNWICYDGDGNPIANAVPGLTTYITLGADVTDGWTAFNAAAYFGTIDLNGHNLAVSCSGTPVFAVTNSSNATRGELRITVPEDATFTKTANFGIAGNISLVKDGPGTLLWSHAGASALAASIPVLVTNGVFKIGVGTGNLFGTSGTVTVKAPGQFDINFSGSDNSYGPVRGRTFYIEGDGPDGSGAIVNSAAKTGWGRHLNKIVLTGDATIGGSGFIDIRDSGNGIDCGGYELTVKNTGRLLVEAGTHLTNATDIVVDGGSLMVCNSCVLGADRIVLEHGGKFTNYQDETRKTYNVPFVVREGSGIIQNAKGYYEIHTSITVESDCTLNFPTAGSQYICDITNKPCATINIGGNFWTFNNIFKNDGTVNHTAGQLSFGYPSATTTTSACTVENDGLIKTTGGTFEFKAESSMTGEGTLELAGGSPEVLGTISDFTGTILLSGGTATVSHFDTFTGTLRLKGGALSSGTSLSGFTGTAVIDVAALTAPLNVDGMNWFTFDSGKEVLVDVGSRELQYGDTLLSWSEKPSNVRFKLQGEHKGILRKGNEGLVYAKVPGTTIIVR